MTYKRTNAALRLPEPDYGPEIEITPDLRRLLAMLRFKRPDGSRAEEIFLARYIDSVPGMTQDDFGNRWITVGSKPEILWSCHTDTVHHDSGMQELCTLGRYVFSGDAHALGADDTAGCWIMLEMIRAGVPGVYAFHRGEEVGGQGSQWAAKHLDFNGVKAAIALDRKGYSSVITHQFGRCCSDAFANSLADILGGSYAPDSTGLFTDTANYTDVIGECSNLSVGYFDAHSGAESLDLEFVRELKDKLIFADFSKLVFERTPGDFDDDDYSYVYGGSYGSRRRDRWDGGWDGGWDGRRDSSSRGGWRTWGVASESLEALVRAHPDFVADMLEHEGWTAESLATYLGLTSDYAEDDDHRH